MARTVSHDPTCRRVGVGVTKPKTKKQRRAWNNNTWIKMQLDKERLEKKPLHKGR